MSTVSPSDNEGCYVDVAYGWPNYGTPAPAAAIYVCSATDYTERSFEICMILFRILLATHRPKQFLALYCSFGQYIFSFVWYFYVLLFLLVDKLK